MCQLVTASIRTVRYTNTNLGHLLIDKGQCQGPIGPMQGAGRTIALCSALLNTNALKGLERPERLRTVQCAAQKGVPPKNPGGCPTQNKTKYMTQVRISPGDPGPETPNPGDFRTETDLCLYTVRG
jgi:hypothetical protein